MDCPQHDKKLPSQACSSAVTASSINSAIHEGQDLHNDQMEHIIKILPSVRVKLVRKDLTNNCIISGELIRSNGYPLNLNNALNPNEFQSMFQRINEKPDRMLVSLLGDKIMIEINFQIQDQSERDRCMALAIQELKFKRDRIITILQIYGLIKNFSSTARKLKAFNLEDRKVFARIRENHKFSDFNENLCCQKEIQDQPKTSQSQTGNCFTQINKITSVQIQPSQANIGTSFIVRKVKAQIQLLVGEEPKRQKKSIAIKRLRPELQSDSYYKNKLEYEQKILKKIKNSKYIVPFYKLKNQNRNEVYMEYIQQTLKDRIKTHSMTEMEKLNISKQLAQSIIFLHDDGIVHHDLKPYNVLIDPKNQIKLIDFGESIEIGTPFRPNDPDFIRLSSTVPYSPLECLLISPEGHAKSKIDNWSLGVIMSELVLGRLPFCYCKIFENEIVQNWTKNQYITGIGFFGKMGIHSISHFLKILSLLLMKFKYRERFCLEGVMQILEHLERRTQSFKDL